MKLKKLLKQGKKEAKKQQVKQEVEVATKVDDEEEQRDDALIDISEDTKKKQQPKPKVAKRVDTNKLEETEIDTSKYIIEKKEEAKPQITSWIVEADKVKDLIKEDFKLHEVEDQFESLTDKKLNEQIKQKKQKKVEEQKTQNIGQLKFAPLQPSPLQSKTTEKITLGFGKPKTETPTIAFSPTPALNFTNSKLGGNVNVAPLQKPTVHLYDDDIERKARERLEQTKKQQQQAKGKGGWFKKTTTEAPKETPKEAPKIQFKPTPMTFTNSALTFTNSALSNQSQQAAFKPIQKSKQEQIYERKQQQFKFVNKKEQEQRRKKRQQEQIKLQQTPVQTQPKA